MSEDGVVSDDHTRPVDAQSWTMCLNRLNLMRRLVGELARRAWKRLSLKRVDEKSFSPEEGASRTSVSLTHRSWSERMLIPQGIALTWPY